MPPTPRITSPTAITPSAGDPFSTRVMHTCRASVVTILSVNIHPRRPVGPRFQSCLASAGTLSPFVKSGMGTDFGGAACTRTLARNATMTANTRNRGRRKNEKSWLCFIIGMDANVRQRTELSQTNLRPLTILLVLYHKNNLIFLADLPILGQEKSRIYEDQTVQEARLRRSMTATPSPTSLTGSATIMSTPAASSLRSK